MDYIMKNKFLAAVIVFLVLLNIGVLAFVFFVMRPRMPVPTGMRREMSAHFIEDRLGLSDQQKARFQQLREEHFAKADKLMRLRAEAMGSLFSLLRKGDASAEDVAQKASVLGALEAHQSTAMFEHFRALRAVCTPEQQQKFDTLITDVLIRRRGPGGGMGMAGFGPGVPGPDGLMDPSRGMGLEGQGAGAPGDGRPRPDGPPAQGARPDGSRPGEPGRGEPGHDVSSPEGSASDRPVKLDMGGEPRP